MYIALPYPITHGHWLKQKVSTCIKDTLEWFDYLCASSTLSHSQTVRQCVYHTECLGTRLAPLLIQIHKVVVPYCPEQTPMGDRSSSSKIWGWAVTWRKCLNGSTIPEQGPTPDAKLAAMGLNRLASLVRPCFVEASPTVEKAVSCHKADRLVASLLSFRSVQSSPPVREFHAAREERCEPSHRQVCANLMSWRPKRIRAM